MVIFQLALSWRAAIPGQRVLDDWLACGWVDGGNEAVTSDSMEYDEALALACSFFGGMCTVDRMPGVHGARGCGSGECRSRL